MAEASATVDTLPGPADRPAADVVIFDGHCRICRGQVHRLHRWDKSDRLAYLSLHDPEVARRYPDLEHDDLMRNMVVVDGAQHRHRGAEAVRYLSRRLPRLWWAMPLLHIPGSMPLWRWLYDLVARYRYKFGRTGPVCDDGACKLHQ